MATAQLPIAVSATAFEFIDQISARADFDEIIEAIPNLFPNSLRIECDFDPGVDHEEDPVVVVQLWLPESDSIDPDTHGRWSRWAATHFPGDVLRHYVVIESFEASNL